jgi:hypothetical protein
MEAIFWPECWVGEIPELSPFRGGTDLVHPVQKPGTKE